MLRVSKSARAKAGCALKESSKTETRESRTDPEDLTNLYPRVFALLNDYYLYSHFTHRPGIQPARLGQTEQLECLNTIPQPITLSP